MPPDPWEVLGVSREASLAEATAAYRRLAALFHPDHLQGMVEAVRLEGERRLRDAAAALDAIRRRSDPDRVVIRPSGQATWDAPITDQPAPPETRAYNAQVRSLDPNGLHATWPGRHAAAMWRAMHQAHTVDGPVRQVEWGAYECTLPGPRLRALLGAALRTGTDEWRREPLETLDVGPPGQRRRYVGHPGQDPPGVMDLEALAGLVDDDGDYLVTAEVFSGFD